MLMLQTVIRPSIESLRIASPAYFHGHTLPRRSSTDLVLVPATGVEAK